MARLPAIPPWEVNPALTRSRLLSIGEWISDVRASVAEDVNPELGDLYFGHWQPGSTAHARLAHRFTAEAQSGAHPWLRVLDPSLQFTFAIDDVPIRIYRGEPDRPSRSAKKAGVQERLRQLEAFDMSEITRADLSWSWRIAVELDPQTLRASRLTLCEVNVDGDEDQVRNQFEIPIRPDVARLTTLAEHRPAGVELEPATVELQPAEADEDGEASAVDGD